MSKNASNQYKLAMIARRTIAPAAAVFLLLASGLGPLSSAQTTPAAVLEPDAAQAAVVNAVWVEREFSFTYMGFGTFYSCSGLRDKIVYILEQVGARPEPRVTMPCMAGSGIDPLPMARIRVAVPAEATPERLAQLAEDQSRRELIARVQDKGDGVDAATAQFPAERRVVQFEGRRRGNRIEDGDCELLDQLLPQVLEPLGVRELPGSSLRCTPKQSQLGAVNLKLESLHALPAQGAATN